MPEASEVDAACAVMLSELKDFGWSALDGYCYETSSAIVKRMRDFDVICALHPGEDGNGFVVEAGFTF